MRVLVTGAGGLLGRRVVKRLLRPGALGAAMPSVLTLVDLGLPPTSGGAEVRRIEGSLTDASVIAAAAEGGVDLLLHLASVPGGAAQADYARGRAVNLEGALALFDAVSDAASPPRVVFTSSIAILGADDRGVVDAATPLRPTGSYGAHKLMMEVQLADLTRRGLVDGRAIRPAGIVPRPPERYGGFATAWMSDIFHAIATGRPFHCPAPASNAVWLHTAGCVADQVLHAARLPAERLPAHRAWTLPATVATLGELSRAIADAAGGGPPDVTFAAAGFGLPGQDASDAEALGFRSDGDVKALVRGAMAELERYRSGAA